MDLTAWVTIVNQAGASFANSQLKLVAGEVNRAPAAPQPAAAGRMMMKAERSTRARASRNPELFEYHLYTLGRRTDLPDNSTKQLELFPAATGVKCQKQLCSRRRRSPGTTGPSRSRTRATAATNEGTTGASSSSRTRKATAWACRCRPGRVRVNQAAQDGSLEFIGEDLIKHTPRNETLRIKLGNAFDIAGERKQTNFVYNEKGRYIDESFELSVRNRKKSSAEGDRARVPVPLEQLERDGEEPRIREARRPDHRLPAHIAADGEREVTYTCAIPGEGSPSPQLEPRSSGSREPRFLRLRALPLSVACSLHQRSSSARRSRLQASSAQRGSSSTAAPRSSRAPSPARSRLASGFSRARWSAPRGVVLRRHRARPAGRRRRAAPSPATPCAYSRSAPQASARSRRGRRRTARPGRARRARANRRSPSTRCRSCVTSTDRAFVVLQGELERVAQIEIQVVGRLVQQQQVGLAIHHERQRKPCLLAAENGATGSKARSPTNWKPPR
jgi:hypothetical protein